MPSVALSVTYTRWWWVVNATLFPPYPWERQSVPIAHCQSVTLAAYHFILLYFIVLYFILFILFYFILFYFILFYFILFYFILFYFILFCFILFYFILFYFILFYFILFYFILFYFILFYFLWLCDPTRVMAFSFLMFLDHTQRRNTVGRTPLDEWSARHRDLYLTTHNATGKHPCPR